MVQKRPYMHKKHDITATTTSFDDVELVDSDVPVPSGESGEEASTRGNGERERGCPKPRPDPTFQKKALRSRDAVIEVHF